MHFFKSSPKNMTRPTDLTDPTGPTDQFKYKFLVCTGALHKTPLGASRFISKQLWLLIHNQFYKNLIFLPIKKISNKISNKIPNKISKKISKNMTTAK